MFLTAVEWLEIVLLEVIDHFAFAVPHHGAHGYQVRSDRNVKLGSIRRVETSGGADCCAFSRALVPVPQASTTAKAHVG